MGIISSLRDAVFGKAAEYAPVATIADPDKTLVVEHPDYRSLPETCGCEFLHSSTGDSKRTSTPIAVKPLVQRSCSTVTPALSKK